MDENLQRAVLEDLAGAVDWWASTASEVLTDPEADIAWADNQRAVGAIRGLLVDSEHAEEVNAAIFEVMRGLMHSALSVFDGATQSAEIGRVFIVDEAGEAVSGALHELFVEHLFETGRIV
ncbi:hypothetical protein ACFHYQ_18025 [Sphaerimonospora cavernae]|uniref:Uncharacterized protein n=1 Tax=Sphaerimonospora cavernae TaxID=1740611 RepID=A0ABV6U6X0_9ACTN